MTEQNESTKPTKPLSLSTPARSGAAAKGGGETQVRQKFSHGRTRAVTVEVKKPGQVKLQGLGLSAAAEPLTPARFDVFAGDPGRHDVRFDPVSGDSVLIGVLRVR